MNPTPIQVFIKTNENQEIEDIDSDLFLVNASGWIKVDEGFGDKFAHAQTQYLPDGLMDDQGHFNYVFEDGKIKRKGED